MTKSIYSEMVDFVAFVLFVLILLVGSGTSHASPASSVGVPVIESQAEIVEMSAWPRIRDSLLGRDRHPHCPPPPHPHDGWIDDYPPPPPPHHHHHRHRRHHR